MKCLALTHKGIEDIASKEIKEKTDKDCEKIESGVIFKTGSYQDVCRLAYKSQSLRRLIVLLGFGKYSSMDDMKKIAVGLDYSEWIKDGKTFCLRSIKSDEVGFSSQEIEREVGGEIKDRMKVTVDLENPDVQLVSYITKDTIFIGVDFSGFDMSKRDYNVFSVQKSIKGDLAYALSDLSGFERGKTFLDPFTGSGGVSIEAALRISGRSPHFFCKDKFFFLNYDIGIDFDDMFEEIDREPGGKANIHSFDHSLMYINSSKKNAKIAGVDKFMKFSRVDTDWLDDKFEEGSVDCVASVLPSIRGDKKAVQMYSELFNQLRIILKGKAVLMSHNEMLLDAMDDNFRLVEKREVQQGKSRLFIFVFQKVFK